MELLLLPLQQVVQLLLLRLLEQLFVRDGDKHVCCI
jgi:hypothetical protein